MNYVQQAKEALYRVYPDPITTDEDRRLVDFYTLLVLTRGENTTLEDVHEAWAIWRNETAPNHESIVPFDELTEEIQAYDKPYRDAIVEAARAINHLGAPRYWDRKWNELA